MVLIEILLVDDNLPLLEAMQKSLEKENNQFKVTIASSVPQALDLMSTFTFDIIISDYQIPDIDGLEFLAKIRSDNNEIPFVMYTGKSREEVAIAALNYGANYYLKKEENTKKQLEQITEIINKVCLPNKTRQTIELESMDDISEAFIRQNPLEIKSHLKQINEIIESMTFGIYLFKLIDEKLIFTFANSYADKLFNLDHSEKYSLEASEAFPGLISTDLVEEYIKVIRTGISFSTEAVTYIDEQISGTFKVKGIKIDSETLMVIFNDISSTKREIIEQQEKIHELKFINETGLDFLLQSEKDDIYEYISEKLSEITEDALIVVTSYNKSKNTFSCQKMMGFGKGIKRVMKILRFNPLDLEITVNEDFMVKIREGRIIPLDDVLGSITSDSILTRRATNRIDKHYNVKNRYVMGLIHQGEIFGAITLSMKNFSDLTNPQLVEVFLRQATAALLRREAENRLLRNEKRYSTLVELMNDGLGIGTNDSIFTYANNKLCDMLGYSKDELIGKNIMDFVHKDDVRKYRREVRNREKGVSSKYELRFITKTGNILHTIIKPRALFEDGVLVGSFAVITDISDIKRKQQVLEMQRDELDSFASTVAHDIRGRLQVLTMIADLDSSDNKELLMNQISEMNAFVNNLIILAKSGNILGKRMNIDLSKLIAETLESLLANNTLEYELINLPIVKIDPIKFKQVLENIFVNILKHSKATKITISGSTIDNNNRITIEDNGIGIEEAKLIEIRESLIKRNYSTLGFHIIEKIMSAHDGDFEIKSTVGEGTKFILYLPQ